MIIECKITIDGIITAIATCIPPLIVYVWMKKDENKKQKLEHSREIFLHITQTYETIELLLRGNDRTEWVSALRLLKVMNKQKKHLLKYHKDFLYQLESQYRPLLLKAFLHASEFYKQGNITESILTEIYDLIKFPPNFKDPFKSKWRRFTEKELIMLAGLAVLESTKNKDYILRDTIKEYVENSRKNDNKI